jgi:hypothetical protein
MSPKTTEPARPWWRLRPLSATRTASITAAMVAALASFATTATKEQAPSPHAAIAGGCAAICHLPSLVDLQQDDFTALDDHYQQTDFKHFQPSVSRAALSASLRDATIAALLMPQPPKPPGTRFYRGGSEEASRVGARASHTPAPGFTEVRTQIDAAVPAARAVSEAFRRHFGLPFLITAYWHPFDADEDNAPICAHSDPQETFILQLDGCRRWELWPGVPRGHADWPFENKRHLQSYASDCQPEKMALLDEKPSSFVDLRRGSLLYIPWRGIVHRTVPCPSEVEQTGPDDRASSRRSIHWSISSMGAPGSAAYLLFTAAQKLSPLLGRALVSELANRIEENVREAEGALGIRLREGLPPAALSGRRDDEIDRGVDRVLRLSEELGLELPREELKAELRTAFRGFRAAHNYTTPPPREVDGCTCLGQ